MDTIDRILALMSDNKVTAAKLTREAGITNGLITQWKKRLQNPSTDNLEKLASYFDVSTDYLLGKTDTKKELTKNGKLSFPEEKFKQLSPEHQQIIQDMVQAAWERSQQQK